MNDDNSSDMVKYAVSSLLRENLMVMKGLIGDKWEASSKEYKNYAILQLDKEYYQWLHSLWLELFRLGLAEDGKFKSSQSEKIKKSSIPRFAESDKSVAL